MNILAPVAEGFFDAMRFTRDMLWTFPKSIIILAVALLISPAQHRQFDPEAALRASGNHR
ncbi:MAG: hypothetical protein QM741_06915 [Rudaea sp.]|uniref:hypothetical protein n=1 Tax=Rudaea sp. TaxID=2136325 RepID=UPI0039E2FB63